MVTFVVPFFVYERPLCSNYGSLLFTDSPCDKHITTFRSSKMLNSIFLQLPGEMLFVQSGSCGILSIKLYQDNMTDTKCYSLFPGLHRRPCVCPSTYPQLYLDNHVIDLIENLHSVYMPADACLIKCLTRSDIPDLQTFNRPNFIHIL